MDDAIATYFHKAIYNKVKQDKETFISWVTADKKVYFTRFRKHVK